MKITKIEINPECDKHLTLGNGINLYPLILTVKTFFSSKEVRVYPTSVGPTYGNDFIHHYHFTDDLGKVLPKSACVQCTNYCKSERFYPEPEREATESINITEL